MFQILIVEDDKELSQLFQKVLEKNGYQVKSASDGAQALEVLDKEYIDLIISDIMMPVMDGYELVSELRSAGYHLGNLRLVVLIHWVWFRFPFIPFTYFLYAGTFSESISDDNGFTDRNCPCAQSVFAHLHT